MTDDREKLLAHEIRRHRQLYYAGTPEISDAEFDALEDRLRALSPDHPVLAEVGAAPKGSEDAGLEQAKAAALSDLRAIVERVGVPMYEGGPTPDKAALREYKGAFMALMEREPDDPVLALAPLPEGLDWMKSRHEIPMGSLNKVNSDEELVQWAARCDEHAQANERPPISARLFATEKLDGLSIEVVYAGGQVERAITRGDGEIGERITPNVVRMQGVLRKISDRRRLSVRGEIVLKKSDADAYRSFREEARGSLGEISLRNTAAGLARSNKPDMLPGVRFLSVYFYDVEGVEGLSSETSKIEFLERLGFTTPGKAAGDLQQILEFFKSYATKRRGELDYEIDGLVVRSDDLDSATLLGDLNNRPRAAVAFKFESEMQVTRLVDILWSTGDSGRITPIAQVEPVRLAGARVVQASLHNLANLERLGIGVGDEVLVSRRNDVIPYVEKVVVKGPNQAVAPTHCGACSAAVERDGEYLVCRNLACPARRIGRLRVWIRQLDLLNWGERTLERLYQEGLAREVKDLYLLSPESLMKLDGFGEITAKKLLEPLHLKKRIPLDTFIAALGVEGVAKETANLLVRAGYDSIDKIAAASLEALAEIPGLGEIKAKRVKGGLAERLDEVRALAEIGVVPVKPAEGGPLAGLSFCFSGSHSKPRKVLESSVEAGGGRVAASVTKGVDYLVLADANSTSSKAEKARKLGTKVIDEAAFDQLLQAAVK
ncbi:MAG: NAD-dependent DNA ligase LigA [Myxococcota bacterium]